MHNILLHTLTATAYLLLAWAITRSRRQAILLPLLVVVLLHAFLLWEDLFPHGALEIGFASALSLMMWLTVVIYLFESLVIRIDLLLRIALVVAAPLSLLPIPFPGHLTVPGIKSMLFDFHLLVAMLAYGVFALAILHALLMGWMEKRLRHGQLPADSTLPSLVTLETLLFRLILVAFALLSLTLCSGAWFAKDWYGQPFPFTHKTVFSILSWLLFATLLWGRHRRGWRGRQVRWWIIGGFIALVLAYIGTSFVFQVLLRRY